MSSISVLLTDFDGYIDHIESATDDCHHADEPHSWVIGTVGVGVNEFDEWAVREPPVEIDDDGDATVKRIGDLVYPADAFADQETTDDIVAADWQLAGLAAFPVDSLDTHHHRVLHTGQLVAILRDLRRHYDNHAIMTGGWAPNRDWSIMADGTVWNAGCLRYPAAVFDDGDVRTLQRAKLQFGGSIILPRDVLSEQAHEVLDGYS